MGKLLSGFNRASGDIARAINSDLTSGEKLLFLVKTAAAALGVKGCSLMLLDAQKQRLFHAAAHGLSERYLRKGFLEADKTVTDVLGGKAGVILDMSEDPRVQFRELAREERIVSTLTVPVKIKEEAVGILRAYSRIRREFTPDETQFLTTAAHLAGVVLQSGQAGVTEPEPNNARNDTRHSLAAQVKTTVFAHPSEEEFARVLDFYQIDWIYEPRSFTLFYDDKPPETFTPDFYLPILDLYIEMTTLKATLMREKKRRVKRMRELYPEINVKLLARRDYDRILAKYGHGPLGGAKTRGVGRVLFSASQIQMRVNELAVEISRDCSDGHPALVGVLRGVFCFMADLMRYLTVPVDVDFMALSYYKGDSGKSVHVTTDVGISLKGRDVILVEDIVDTGMTLSYVLNHLRACEPASLKVCTLLDKKVRRLAEVELDYVGFEVPDEFLVGYGLDYQEEYRNLPFIALMEEPEQIAPAPDLKV